jgi:multicomponent Na+:H+ antiporter subunit C
MSSVIDVISGRYAWFIIVALLGLGLWATLTERHLIKKLVGLSIFQTAIFLFYIEGSVRTGGEVPVIDPELGSNPEAYVNPLPHVLMLTGLVVAVAVLGVALALAVVIHRSFGTLDDEELSAEKRQS